MKKFTALFLVLSLLMISANLYAKKRGAKLIIARNDGTQFKGELILVKGNSLLIFAPKGKEASIDIDDIEKIVIVKKSKRTIWTAAGGLIGAAAGGLICTTREFWEILILGLYVEIGGAIGGLVGYLIGKAAMPNKVISIEGMTESEIQETLDYLGKKARIRDYK